MPKRLKSTFKMIHIRLTKEEFKILEEICVFINEGFTSSIKKALSSYHNFIINKEKNSVGNSD